MNLRECIIIDFNATKQPTGHQIFYFHKWIELAKVQVHPEDPQGDKVITTTMALIENISTGKVEVEHPQFIQFIDKL
jgi:hypothetical protein